MGLPPAVCDEHNKVIEECVVLSKEGGKYLLQTRSDSKIMESRLRK